MTTVPLINDRYELVDVIASGGMATVWRARDTRLKRLVALKRPHPGSPGDESRQRLSREARAAAALNHPNLITVYDFGVDDEGPYLVMELVDGPTLEDDAETLEPAEITELGVALANALAAIHASGIVHRDVKPSNVIMSDRGPLLTDFGIALDPNATSEITAPGRVVATPSYAAPEVLRGEPPTPASDVYSLGLVIDELLERAGGPSDDAMKRALGAAMAAAPEDRPTAVGLATLLAASAPTVTGIASSGTTMVLEAAPSPPTGDDGAAGGSGGPVWGRVAAVLAVLAIGLLALGVALSGGEPPAAATDSTLAAPAATSTTASSSTTSSPTTSSTSSTPTTIPTAAAMVAEARDELEEILARPPRSSFNPREVEDVMKKVDEAIVAAEEGDYEKAGKKLSEAARTIDEKLDGDRRDEAITAVERLAELLGFEVVSRERGDDD